MVNAMGAKTFLAVALATLSWTGVSAAQAPTPGTLETYKDWTIGCDNRNRCEAVALLPEGGAWPDNPVMVGIVRDAGPEAEAEVWTSRDAKGTGEVGFFVDGRRIAAAQSRDGDATVRGPQAAALAIAMARSSNWLPRACPHQRNAGHPLARGTDRARQIHRLRAGNARRSAARTASPLEE